MKTLRFTAIILFIPLLLTGQDSYYDLLYYFNNPGDTLTVAAKSGLNLRDSSSTDSKKIMRIPFGDKVVFLSRGDNSEVIDNRIGYWLRVLYKNKEGYLFSGFLSKLSIPKFEKSTEDDCWSLWWFEKLTRANADTLVCKGKKIYKGSDMDGKDWSSSFWEIYTNETEIYHAFGYESEDLIIETTSMHMNDVLNLLEYLINELTIQCNSDYYSKGEDSKIVIDKDENGFIKTITYRNFIAEKSIHKLTIRVHLWDL